MKLNPPKFKSLNQDNNETKEMEQDKIDTIP